MTIHPFLWVLVIDIEKEDVWAMYCSYIIVLRWELIWLVPRDFKLYIRTLIIISKHCAIVYHTCYLAGYKYLFFPLPFGSSFVLLRWLLFQGSVLSYLGIWTTQGLLYDTFRTQGAERIVAREVWNRARVVYHPFTFANESAAWKLADGTIFHEPLNWLTQTKSAKIQTPEILFQLNARSVYLLGQPWANLSDFSGQALKRGAPKLRCQTNT